MDICAIESTAVGKEACNCFTHIGSKCEAILTCRLEISPIQDSSCPISLGSQQDGELGILSLHNCCTVMTTKFIGPYFFEDDNGETCTVNSHCYRNMNQTFLVHEIQDNDDLCFQQDGATVHTAVINMTALRNLFQGHLISRFGDVIWLRCSPDLTAPDYFLWGHLKHKVFETRPANVTELRNRIRKEINGIQPATLRPVMRDFQHRIHLCIENGVGHLTDIILKK